MKQRLDKVVIKKAKVIQDRIIKKRPEQKPLSDSVRKLESVKSKNIEKSKARKAEKRLVQSPIMKPKRIQNRSLPKPQKTHEPKPVKSPTKSPEKWRSSQISPEKKKSRSEPVAKRAKSVKKEEVKSKEPKQKVPKQKRPVHHEPKQKKPRQKKPKDKAPK